MARRKQKSQAGRLRIVAGNWRGRLLDIADVEGLRPTSDRVRETLFNWLAPHIHGARCLDLFAGTGALGLEALSRGAGETVFVERSPVAARQLEKNVELLVGGPVGAALAANRFGPEGPPTSATVICGDAKDFLKANGGVFDIVFLDPPFAADALTETCRLLAESQALADDALVYLEMERSQQPPALPEDWQVRKDKTAGNVRYMLARSGGND